MTLEQIITIIVAIVVAALPTYLTNRYDQKKRREQAEKEFNIQKATELYRIIKPVLQTPIFTWKQKDYDNTMVFRNILSQVDIKDSQLVSDFTKLLCTLGGKRSISLQHSTASVNCNRELTDLLCLELAHKCNENLVEFLIRYNTTNTIHDFKLYIDLLNKDIEFINKHLGMCILPMEKSSKEN